MQPEFIQIHATCADMAEAQAIARALVQGRLAACVNIIPHVTSVYQWAGEMQESAEVLLLAKTRSALFDDAAACIRARHSYDTPCILALPIHNGHAPFLEWVTGETTA